MRAFGLNPILRLVEPLSGLFRVWKSCEWLFGRNAGNFNKRLRIIGGSE